MNNLFWIFTVLTILTRLYMIHKPAEVVFDEVHFGGFASHYLKRSYFFDVHPPLGKLIIASVGYLRNYKGTFSFNEVQVPYADDPSVPFISMRVLMGLFGSISILFALSTMVEMGFSPLGVGLTGIFLTFRQVLKRNYNF